jgi:hypothetical protein
MSTKSRTDRLSERLQRSKQHRQWAVASQSVTSVSSSATTVTHTERVKSKLDDAFEADKRRRSPTTTGQHSVASAPARIGADSLTQRRQKIAERRKFMGSPCVIPLYAPLASSRASPTVSPTMDDSSNRISYRSSASPPMTMMDDTLPNHNYPTLPEPKSYSNNPTISAASSQDYRFKPVEPATPDPLPSKSYRYSSVHSATSDERGNSDRSFRLFQNPKESVSSSVNEQNIISRSRTLSPSVKNVETTAAKLLNTTRPPWSSSAKSTSQQQQEQQPRQPSPWMKDKIQSDTTSVIVAGSVPLTSAAPWSRDSLRKKSPTSQKDETSKQLLSPESLETRSLQQPKDETLTRHQLSPENIDKRSSLFATGSEIGDTINLSSAPSSEVSSTAHVMAAWHQRESALKITYETRQSISRGGPKKWPPVADPTPTAMDDTEIDTPRRQERTPPKQYANPTVASITKPDEGNRNQQPWQAKIESKPSTLEEISISKPSWLKSMESQQRLRASPVQHSSHSSVISSWQIKQQHQKMDCTLSTDGAEAKRPAWNEPGNSTEKADATLEQRPKSPARQWPPPKQQQSTPSWKKPITSDSSPQVDIVSPSRNQNLVTKNEKPSPSWQRQDEALTTTDASIKSQQPQGMNTTKSRGMPQKFGSTTAITSPPWARKHTAQPLPESNQGLSRWKNPIAHVEIPTTEPAMDLRPSQSSYSGEVIETSKRAHFDTLRASFGSIPKVAPANTPIARSQVYGNSRGPNNDHSANSITSTTDESEVPSTTIRVATSLVLSPNEGSELSPMSASVDRSSPQAAQSWMVRHMSSSITTAGSLSTSTTHPWRKKSDPESAKVWVAPSARHATPDDGKPSWAIRSKPPSQHEIPSVDDQVVYHVPAQSWSPSTNRTQFETSGQSLPEKVDNGGTFLSPDQEQRDSLRNFDKVSIGDALLRWNPSASPINLPLVEASPLKSLAAMAAESAIITDYHQLQLRRSDDSFDDVDSRSIGMTPKKSEVPIQFQSILDQSNSMENNISMESDSSSLVFSHNGTESEAGLLGPEAIEKELSMSLRNTNYPPDQYATLNSTSLRPLAPSKLDAASYRTSGVSPMKSIGYYSSDREGYAQRNVNENLGGTYTSQSPKPGQLNLENLNQFRIMRIDTTKHEESEAGSSVVSSAVFGDPTSFGAAGGDDVQAKPLPVAVRAKAIEEWNGGKSPTVTDSPYRAPPVLRESYRGQGMVRDDIDKKSVRFNKFFTDVKLLRSGRTDVDFKSPELLVPVGVIDNDTGESPSAIGNWQRGCSSIEQLEQTLSPPRSSRETSSILRYFENAEPGEVDQDHWGDKDPDALVEIRDDDSITSSAPGMVERDLKALQTWHNPIASPIDSPITSPNISFYSSPPRRSPQSSPTLYCSPQRTTPLETQESPIRSPATSEMAVFYPPCSSPEPDLFSNQNDDTFLSISSSNQQEGVFDPFIADDDDSFFDFGTSNAALISQDSGYPIPKNNSPFNMVAIKPPRQLATTRSRRRRSQSNVVYNSSYDDDYYGSRVAAIAASKLKVDPYSKNAAEF